MLKQLKLSNFKIFNDEVSLRFRPITLLIGKNNAGKSSIIEFLLMLQQSTDFPGYLDSAGSLVDLGPVCHLKNSETMMEDLNFQLDILDNHSIKISGRYPKYEESSKNKFELSAEEESVEADTKSLQDLLFISTPLTNNANGYHEILNYLQKIINSEYGKDKWEFLQKYMSSIASVDRIQFNNPGTHRAYAFNLSLQCSGHNSRTGTKTNFCNLGSGADKILPILVEGATTAEYSTLVVKQPEAMLHPSTHLELGSSFAELWSKHKVCSVIETHSSNIMLRLQTLIAKGKLKAEDVSIAFFDTGKNRKAIIQNISIKNDGSLTDGLPLEFFNQDIWESLAMNAQELSQSPLNSP